MEAAANAVSFLRLEFQDGKRKAASQDYHGSGRARAHQLDYVGSADRRATALKLQRSVRATLGDGPLRSLARKKAYRRTPKTAKAAFSNLLRPPRRSASGAFGAAGKGDPRSPLLAVETPGRAPAWVINKPRG